MYSKVKIGFLSTVLLAVVGLGYFCFEYYNASINITKSETDLYLNSENLVHTFRSNEVFANSIYVEKVIEIEGVIKEIVQQNDRSTIVLQGNDEFSYVLCDMLQKEAEVIKDVKSGQKIHIKGICKGYLNDVIMLNCIVVNQKTNE